jgi:hypothetical protein
MQWIESAYKIAAVVNFVTFLRFGKYRSALGAWDP